MRCPSFDDLADYVDELTDARTRHTLERHLVACEPCRRSVREQRELIGRLRAVPVDGTRHDSLVAGLLHLGELPGGSPVTGASRQGPLTVSDGAPAQYVSARRSLACAAVAAIGCVSAALVAANVPSQGGQGPAGGQVRVVSRTPGNADSMVAPALTVVGVQPVIVHAQP